MASMNRRNDHSKENMSHRSFQHLTVVLRQTRKIMNPSFKLTLHQTANKHNSLFKILGYFVRASTQSQKYKKQVSL